MLQNKIQNGESGIALYGIVPPKKGTDAEKIREIAELQMQRLEGQKLDGLILYDIQDEKSRTSATRPFPFMETLDSYEYAHTHLKSLDIPKIIYRAVGKYSENELIQFMNHASQIGDLSVFVGASAQDQAVTMSIKQAYDLRRQNAPELLLGGVTIPERHTTKGDEHTRVFNKLNNGCSFFVSQGVYDVNASKNFLSDYYYSAKEQGINLAPIIFTLTPCGSIKTLDFMKWLGISIPRWLENELIHSEDILGKSVDISQQNYLELKEFADDKGIPIGFNIESVAVRKVEVEASIELLQKLSSNN